MDMSSGIRDRIFSAADTLHDQAGRQAFPTVDAVRKLAKVNMNDASTGMRAWRRAQSAKIAPMAVQIPDALQQSSVAGLAALWSEAMALANETLRAAQAGWDAERAEAEALREQMANAYEAQVTDLETARAELARCHYQIERLEAAMISIQRQSEALAREVGVATTSVTHAETKATEIERRANELRKELDHAHALAMDTSGELMAARKSHSDEIAALREELARTRQKAELDGLAAQATLSQAIETAATLRGELAVLARQSAATAQRHSRKKSEGVATK